MLCSYSPCSCLQSTISGMPTALYLLTLLEEPNLSWCCLCAKVGLLITRKCCICIIYCKNTASPRSCWTLPFILLCIRSSDDPPASSSGSLPVLHQAQTHRVQFLHLTNLQLNDLQKSGVKSSLHLFCLLQQSGKMKDIKINLVSITEDIHKWVSISTHNLLWDLTTIPDMFISNVIY